MTVDEEAVHAANQAFYRAFESLALSRMIDAWWHEGPVSCIHPGWGPAVGWEAVLDTWETLFANIDEMRFDISDERIDVQGELAWVVCTERVLSHSPSGTGRGVVLATNLFRRERGEWRMVHHHASQALPLPSARPPSPPGGDERGEPTRPDLPVGAARSKKRGVVN